ncbi:MAG: hypothetical protein QOG56_707 [Solirubrobacteraceae bacterium]|jgi:hypothetical protein|nr:hypothetical protein [Solirubrobacteraceae bacterium]
MSTTKDLYGLTLDFGEVAGLNRWASRAPGVVVADDAWLDSLAVAHPYGSPGDVVFAVNA